MTNHGDHGQTWKKISGILEMRQFCSTNPRHKTFIIIIERGDATPANALID